MNPLKSYLARAGIAGSAFAKTIGVSPSFLSRIMAGEREADATLIAAIARHSPVTADQWVQWWEKERAQ